MPYPSDDVAFVRLLAGDADTAELLLDTASYEALIVFTGGVAGPADPVAAAVQAALAIAGKFSRQIDGTNGDVSRSYSQRAAAFRAHAEALRTNGKEMLAAARLAKGLAAPMVVAGGIDGARDFAVGMTDRPGTVLPGRERDELWPSDDRAGY